MSPDPRPLAGLVNKFYEREPCRRSNASGVRVGLEVCFYNSEKSPPAAPVVILIVLLLMVA
jgi:hypothetical protein